MVYQAKRDPRFQYVSSVLEHIEQNNCIKGCVFAEDATEEFPGGLCDTLMAVGAEDEVEEIEDTGDVLVCHRRIGP